MVSEAAATTPEGGLLEVIVAAVLYVAYNVAVVPAVLFCLHRQTRRSETLSSGALAGVAMTVPFALTLACLLRSPQASVMEAEVPWLPLIGAAADGRASGYGTLAWGFMALVVVPLFVVVPWRSLRATALSSTGTSS